MSKELSTCGLDCAACNFYLERTCGGCRVVAPEGKCVWGGRCDLYDCVAGKNLDHCGACEKFPCDTLKEWASGEGSERIQNLIDLRK